MFVAEPLRVELVAAAMLQRKMKFRMFLLGCVACAAAHAQTQAVPAAPSVPALPAASVASTAPATAQSVPAPAPAAPAVTFVQPTQPMQATPPNGVARAPAPLAPPTPPVATLPPDAPKIVISGGVYSESKQARAAIVNGQVAREGDDVGSGVVLEQIRPQGVVLAYRGARYTVVY